MLIVAVMLISSAIAHAQSPKDLYLDLMKKCLLNEIYQDGSFMNFVNFQANATYDQSARDNGKDWPKMAHTMIGRHRLDNLQFCVEDVLQHDVQGDFIETGVWRGGAVIFMRSILKAYDITDRRVFVADSFAGLPAPDVAKYPQDHGFDLSGFKELAISLEEVKTNFARYDLLDNQVIFLKGWFKDTLPLAPIEKLAILRLDGDLYESTWDALINLYPKLSIGGYVIIDDYNMGLPCCTKAVHDFRTLFNIDDPMYPTKDGVAVYWKRSK